MLKRGNSPCHVEVVGGASVMISNMSVVFYRPSSPCPYPCLCPYSCLGFGPGPFAKLAVMSFEEVVVEVIVSWKMGRRK